MEDIMKMKDYYNADCAKILSKKIIAVYPVFSRKSIYKIYL
jgi:hypothetical protein